MGHARCRAGGSGKEPVAPHSTGRSACAREQRIRYRYEPSYVCYEAGFPAGDGRKLASFGPNPPVHGPSMRPNVLAGAGLLAALAFALPSGAQSPICMPFAPPWASNNAGTAGGVVMFDTTVNTALLVNQIDVNCSATAGTPVTLEVYTCPVTWSGNQATPAAWTLVATDAGGALTAGREAATSFTLNPPWQMSVGTYGVGIRVVGSGEAYTGTGTGGTPIVVTTNELSLTGGGACSALFAGTQFSIRNWNGCLHYVPAVGLYPNFSGSPTSGSSPLLVNFTDLTYTSDPNGVQTWSWDFDNDGNPDSNLQNPSHTYNLSGTYSVALTVTDNTFGTASITKIDYIVVDPVAASFTASPTLGTVPLMVSFTDTSTGNPILWAWDFDNDGTIDSTLQNPTHTYTTAGRYTVKLTVANTGNSDSVTRVDLITAVGATNNTASADILEFQFNEPRGARVNNTASTTIAPAYGTVTLPAGPPNAIWQGDAGRTGFGANEPGIGCLGADNVTPYESRIDTGWPFNIVGSHTIMFWARVQSVTSFGYAFGGSVGSARCYHDGSRWSLRSYGSLGTASTAYVLSASNPMTLVGWNHWAMVLDDAAGTAQWYLNGVADGTPTAFSPNTFVASGLGNFIVGDYGTLTSSHFTRYADMDDFRIYGRALTPAEIMTAMASENATTGTFGNGCSGPATTPFIGAGGSAPVIGNPTFTIDVGGMEAFVPQALNIAAFAVAGGVLPYNLGGVLPTFAGCSAELFPDVSVGLAGTATASVPIAIPAIPALAGAHAYAQAIVLGSVGAVSPALDIHMQ
ncbi:MAG: PKD domain-containing protein [Planctomycetes bacterium]|nr:PKD domain-containing protein [Planctomycetota bacterium]